MATSVTIQPANGGTSIAAQSFTGDSTYRLVATIQNVVVNAKRLITGTVGGGVALTGLKFTFASYVGGTHSLTLTDTDFNTATTLCPVATSNAYTTASGSTFAIEVDFTGVGELKVYGKAASGTPTIALEIA